MSKISRGLLLSLATFLVVLPQNAFAIPMFRRGKYVPTRRDLTQRDLRGDEWLAQINPGGPSAFGRADNCIDCADATDRMFKQLGKNPRGADPRAAGLRFQPASIGGRFQRMTLEEIIATIRGSPQGSHGYIRAVSGGGVGHVFNFIRDGGERFIDGQLGRQISNDELRGWLLRGIYSSYEIRFTS